MKKRSVYTFDIISLILLAALLGRVMVTLGNTFYAKWLFVALFEDENIVYGLTGIFIISAFVITVISVFMRKTRIRAYCVLKYILIAILSIIVLLYLLLIVFQANSYIHDELADSLTGLVFAWLLFEFAPTVVCLALSIISAIKVKKWEKADVIPNDAETAAYLEIDRREREKKLKQKQEKLRKKQAELEKELNEVKKEG